MSINTAHANGGVLIYNGEVIVLYCDGVELVIEGISSKEFAGTKKGRIYLTTHRMIFLNKSEKDNLQSFSFPFYCMSGLDLEQPIFGANYIRGTVHALAGGNWTGQATFKLKFFSGGAIEFGQAMLAAARIAQQNMPPEPPPYTPHQGPYYPAPPPAYCAPPGGINGFVPPTNVFPNAPPANSVFTMDMPPPYPGIYPPLYAHPPGSNQYPQPGLDGNLIYGPTGPPPPGFYTPGGYPPPYNPNAPSAPMQHNGTTQQPPSNNDNKMNGFAPVYDFYVDPRNPQRFYTTFPPHGNPQEPPPPYFEGSKKNQ